MKPRLAASMGDPAGIGPEILLAAATRASVRRACSLSVFGDPAVLELASRTLGLERSAPSAVVEVQALSRLRVSGRPPRPGRACGAAAFDYLSAAARAVLDGRYDALVTAPLNKMWMNRAGHVYDGHTGYLSELCGRPATMMLAGRRLRVVLVTTHIAISEVPRALSVNSIVRASETAAEHLRRYLAIERPRLAVAALNPHGGEAGLFGDEEGRFIAPAAKRLRRAGIDVAGPLPADTLFAAAAAGDYDAVICMYHDQALIPLKLLDFGRAVNVSMGLPLIRTSPDHGTAYGLAGSGTADPESMVAAILLAAEMARKRASASR